MTKQYLVIPLEDVENMIKLCESVKSGSNFPNERWIEANVVEIEFTELKTKGTILSLDSSIEERAEELYPIVDVDCGEFGIVDSNYWDRENYLEGCKDAQINSEIEKALIIQTKK